MADTIKNSSISNTYFTNAGVAITSSTQPNKNAGAVSAYNTADLDNGNFVGTGPGNKQTTDETTWINSSLDGVNKAKSTAALPYFEEGKYVIRGVSDTLAGLSNEAVKLVGSSEHRRSIDKLEAVRTLKVAAHIVNNQWSTISGAWITNPSGSSDLSSFGTDNESASIGWTQQGSFRYLDGSPTGVQNNYDAKG